MFDSFAYALNGNYNPDECHPDYMTNVWYWERNRALYNGLRGSSSTSGGFLYPSARDGGGYSPRGGDDYLPMPRSMELDRDNGWRTYSRYKARAVHHHLLRQAVSSALGRILLAGDPFVGTDSDISAANDITPAGLQALYRYTCEEILITGRCILLATIVEGRMVIVPIEPERVKDWDVSPSGDVKYLVVEQTNREFIDGTRQDVTRTIKIDSSSGIATMEVSDDKRDVVQRGELAYQGATTPVIPCVIVGSSDITGAVDMPIYDQVAALDMAVYRGDADYRQYLHESGQATLVITGEARGGSDDGDGSIRTGAGAVITVEQGGNVEYVSVSGSSLSEMRSSILQDITEAREIFGAVQTGGTSSAEAIRLRQEAQLAAISQITQTASSAIVKIVRQCAEWSGQNINIETRSVDIGSTSKLTAADILSLTNAKQAGAPISQRSLHDAMRRNAMTGLTFEDEIESLDEEASTVNVGEFE